MRTDTRSLTGGAGTGTRSSTICRTGGTVGAGAAAGSDCTSGAGTDAIREWRSVAASSANAVGGRSSSISSGVIAGFSIGGSL